LPDIYYDNEIAARLDGFAVLMVVIGAVMVLLISTIYLAQTLPTRNIAQALKEQIM